MGTSALSASIQERAGIRLTGDQVRSLMATAGDTQVQLEWQPLAAATSYLLSYFSDNDNGNAQTIETTNTEQLIKDLNNGDTYTFTITAINPVSRSEVVQRQARPLPSAPDSPTNLRATNYLDGGIELVWDEVTNASNYTVYYQLGETLNSAEALSTETIQTSISLENLTNYSTYTFAVTASNPYGEGGLSPSVQARTGIRLSQAPENLTATPDQSAIKLSWSALASATGYRIYYQLADNPASETSTDTSITEITLTDLVPDKIYIFRVQGFNPLGVSALSVNIRAGVFSNTGLTITPIQGQQALDFSWDAQAGTSYYRLLSDLGRGGGFEDASTTGFVVIPSSTYLRQTTATARLSLHSYVPLTDGPLYRLESCSNQTCNSVPVGTASVNQQQLNQLIGYIKASNPGEYDYFGRSVALSDDGNILAVGAPQESGTNNLSNSGAVYVYTREDGAWSYQITYLKASNPSESDNFGWSLSLSNDGNTLAVGASAEDGSGSGINPNDDNTTQSAGAVYLY